LAKKLGIRLVDRKVTVAGGNKGHGVRDCLNDLVLDMNLFFGFDFRKGKGQVIGDFHKQILFFCVMGEVGGNTNRQDAEITEPVRERGASFVVVRKRAIRALGCRIIDHHKFFCLK